MRGGIMKKLWLVVSLVCMSLGLQACGGGGPSVTHLGVVVTGSATAGTTSSVTINALDSKGNVVASYMGTVQITSSDPQAILPGNTTLVNGTATVQITFKTAGNQTIMVSDATHRLSSTGPVSVSAAQLSQLSVTSLPTSISAGTAFNITVSGADAFNNVVASYTGTVHITSKDSQAVLPSDMKLQNGTGNFSVTLKTAGLQTITATDTANSSLAGMSAGVTVNPGPVAHISVNAPPAVTTNLAFMITVSAADNFGNPVPSYTGTLKFTSSDTQAALPMSSPLMNGTQTFPVTLVTIGPQTITASDTMTASLKGTSGAINVVTNAATHLSVTGPPSSLTRRTVSVTVTALDAANNASTGYAGTVHFTSSDAQAKLPADSTLTMGTGNFPVTFEAAGADTITATDTTKSSITGMAAINVNAAAALAITSGNPPNGKVGVRYDPRTAQVCNPFCHRVFLSGFPLSASGGVFPYTWSWAAAVGSSLPAGLSVVNRASGCGVLFSTPPCIVGAPTQAGTFNVVVTVTDEGSPSVQTTANYTITIAPPPPPVVNATPAPLPRGENLPYSFTFTASGYPPVTWSESGALPTGLMLDSNTGTLSGTSTQTGSFPISVTATDQFNQHSAAVDFTIVITPHGFAATGSMSAARRFHTATLLSNGKVLVAGGEDAGSNAFSSAELYDPATGMFTPTTHNMTVARAGHTATLLNNGKVLITGGATDATEAAAATAELYDPSTDTFTATSGPMTAARVEHTATLLQSGKVLIAGGDVIFFNGIQNTGIMSLNTAETFDPSTGKFTKTTGNMTVGRESHTATLLNSGKVLLAGGSDGALGNNTPAATIYANADLFDPSTGQFTATTGMLTAERDFVTANLLGSGKVLLAGGVNTTMTLGSADLFDPSSQSFTATGNLVTPRFYHDATALNDTAGTILVTGGVAAGGNTAAAETYDPTGATFTVTGSMLHPRVWHTSTLLPNGKVLVTGGEDDTSALVAVAELYQ
jgi:hypothetical protein